MPHPTSRRVLIGAAILTVLSVPGLNLPALAQHMDHSLPVPPATTQKSTGSIATVQKSTVQKSTVQKSTVQKPAVQKPAGLLPLRATNASVVAVPPMIRETSVFGTLINTGRTPIVLKGVRAEIAGHGMLMVTRKSSGGMQGMSMTQTLTVPAGGKLVLSDTGDHLMLTQLKRPLKIGETLTLTLTASDGRTFALKATVRKPGAP